MTIHNPSTMKTVPETGVATLSDGENNEKEIRAFENEIIFGFISTGDALVPKGRDLEAMKKRIAWDRARKKLLEDTV